MVPRPWDELLTGAGEVKEFVGINPAKMHRNWYD